MQSSCLTTWEDSAGGAAEAAFGSLTGNANLQSSGEALKQSGVDELKAYQSAHPPSGNASSLEAKVGSAVGCEGLVNDAQGSTTGSTGSSLSNTNSVSAASGVGGVIKDDGSANAGLQDILAGGVQPGKGVSQGALQLMRSGLRCSVCTYRLAVHLEVNADVPCQILYPLTDVLPRTRLQLPENSPSDSYRL